MKIEVAGCSGFCFGVKRAINMAKQALAKNTDKDVYSLGHIIHNSQVVDELSREGLKTIKTQDVVREGVIVISSHGAGPEVFDQISQKGIEVVDATCPYVMSAQKIVRSLNDEGYSILILGDSDHPEIRSLVGFARGKATVIRDASGLTAAQPLSKKIGVLSQTTQTQENYYNVISEVLKREFQEVRIFNTICNDTKKRQESAARLAGGVDVMIIVGGRMSANTKRLFEICSDICEDTYHIETAEEIDQEWLRDVSSVGIASGASTPDWIIEEVKNKCLSRREDAGQEIISTSPAERGRTRGKQAR
ncbi:MAG: 4-hydroxy-3-methylbut-2-enyl diphosphate reductase [Candidatus Omnitrophica bacterium]|nr:4-hydroxy-3-methylbut-2-enyl diphosphate reductase [Candidatus Omnitrophota bacterium]